MEEGKALKTKHGAKLALSLALLLSMPAVVRWRGVPGAVLERGGWAGSTRAVQGSLVVWCFVAN